MWHRIRQFFHALTAKMTIQDKQLVAKYLSPAEQGAFYAMDVNSQKHCVLVTRTCLSFLEQQTANQAECDPKMIETNHLLRAALLHDIGKVKGDLGTIDRVMVVVVNKWLPGFVAALSLGPDNLGSGLTTRHRHDPRHGLRHAFYVHRHHSELGQEKAIKLGVEPEVCTLIAKHHYSPDPWEPIELTLLRKADNLH